LQPALLDYGMDTVNRS